MVGNGAVYGAISGDQTVVVTANGALTMGDASSTDGFDVEGELNVGSNQVTLLDSNRACLGALTTIDDDGVLCGLNGLRIDSGEKLTATGSAMIKGPMYNDGVINGPTNVDKTLTFNDDVTGSGSYTGNITFTKGFMPGNSPDEIDFADGDVSFGGSSLLVMELFGQDSEQCDYLTGMDHLAFDGKLRLDFGFTPEVGTVFDLLDFTSFSGDFSDIEVVGMDPTYLDFSNLPTMGTIAVVPEPSSLCLLATLALALLVWRRRKALAI